MKKGISPKERDMLIGLVGVLIAVAVWFLYASPTIEKTDALRSENTTLSVTASEYESVNLRVDEYSEGIIKNGAEVLEVTDRYPGEVRTEDQLMFWANISSSYPLQLFFGDIEIEERDAVALTGVEDLGDVTVTDNEDGTFTVADSDVEDITAKYVLYGAPMGMNFNCTYEGMKNMFNYIIKQYNKNVILGTEIKYDETTGVLTGNIAVELYYIEGLDKPYTPTFIPAVPAGQKDVFHTGTDEYDAAANEITSLYERITGNKLEKSSTPDNV